MKKVGPFFFGGHYQLMYERERERWEYRLIYTFIVAKKRMRMMRRRRRKK